MKKTYLIPSTDVVQLSSAAIMIGASAEGKKIVTDGGTTSEGNITEGDARRRRTVWDDDEEEQEW